MVTGDLDSRDSSSSNEDGTAMQDGSIQEVTSKVFIGDLRAALSAKTLETYGISAVVSAMRESYPPALPSLRLATFYVRVNDDNESDMLTLLPDCVDWIDAMVRRDRSVLVHCQAGMSRSATIISAYLMRYGRDAERMTVSTSLAAIRLVRPQIEPNKSFMEQLELYHACQCRPNDSYADYRIWKARQRAREVTKLGNAASLPRWESSPQLNALGSPEDRRAATLRKGGIKSVDLTSTSGSRDFGQVRMLPDLKALKAARSQMTRTSPTPSQRHAGFVERRSSLELVSERGPVETSASERGPPAETEDARQAQDRSDGEAGPSEASHFNSESSDVAHGLGIVPETASAVDGHDPDPALREIRCRLCRRTLVTSDRVMRHDKRSGEMAFKSGRKAAAQGIPSLPFSDHQRHGPSPSSTSEPPVSGALLQIAQHRRDPSVCSSIFLTDPPDWLEPSLSQGELSGRMLCPNERCRGKVGTWNWSGDQCGCGQWIVPCFKLARARVDG